MTDLDRLSRSPDADRLVLKGGMLLAVWDARRPTRDIDLAGRRIPGDVEGVLGLVRRVAGIDIDDGLAFDSESAAGESIREDDAYSGIRVTVYNGPVINGSADGGQWAWQNYEVHRTQSPTEQIASGFEALAQVVTKTFHTRRTFPGVPRHW